MSHDVTEVPAATGVADTFISYAREDSAFVQKLVAALIANGRAPWIDSEGILPADEWMDSVRDAIDNTEAFVFVVSPDSMSSTVCGSEVSHASQQGKRLIPVVFRDPVSGTVPEVLGPISALNWIFLRPTDDFDAGIALLVRALETDIDLVRTHTRVLTRAKAWELSGHRASPLLRGEELHQAEAWLARAASGAEPKPNALQSSFVAASRRATSRRQRNAIGASLGIAVLAMALSLVAVTQRNQARSQRRLAVTRQLTAEATAALNIDPQLSVILATEAVRVKPTDDAVFSAVAALDASFVERIMHGPGRDLMDVAYSPDGTQLAGVDLDGVITVWRGKDGGVSTTLTANRRGLLSVRYSPDGRSLVAAGFDGIARIWDVAGHRIVTELQGHSAPITRVVFSPDGNRVATASRDGTARVWDTSSGRQLLVLRAHTDQVLGLAFAPDGMTIASAGGDGRVILWNASTGSMRRELRGHTVAATAVAFSPDGTQLASAGDDATVRLWAVPTGQARRVFATSGPQFNVEFSPDGRMVASSGDDHAVSLWDANLDPDQRGIVNERARPIHVFRGHRSLVQGLAFRPDGRLLASSSGDRTVRVWRVGAAPGAADRAIFDGRAANTYPVPIRSLSMSSDGSRIAIASVDGRLRVVDTSTGRSLADVDVGNDVADVAFAPDARTLVVSSDTATTLRTGNDATLIRALEVPPSTRSLRVRFGPNGDSVATADLDGRVRIFDARTGALTRTVDAGNGEATAIAFSNNGAALATGSQGGDVRLWNSETGAMTAELPNAGQRVNDLRFGPENKTLIVASDDPGVRVWTIATTTILRTLRGHTAAVLRISASADGRTIVTGSEDSTARVWDETTGRLTRVLTGHVDYVTGVAIEPNARFLTASTDGRVLEWNTCGGCSNREKLLQRLGAATVRCLTNAERRTFLGEATTNEVDEPCAA